MPTKAEIQRDLNEKTALVNQLNRQVAEQRAELDELRQRFERIDRAENEHRQRIEQQQQVQLQQHPRQQAPQHPQQHAQQHKHPVQQQVPIQQIQQQLPQHMFLNPAVYQQPPNHFGRAIRYCRAFSGKERMITPQAWIDFFQFRTAALSDAQRCEVLADYLDEDAQDWYMRQRTAQQHEVNWNVLRQSFITFFSSSVQSPGVTAANLKFKPTDELKTYFQEKCRYFDLANLQMADRIDFLTDGVTEDSIREGLLIASINSLEEWFQKAKALVSNYERKKEREKESSKQRFVPKTASTIKPSFKPHNKNDYIPPCKICKSKGKEARHWHSECPHRDSPSPAASAPRPKVRHVCAKEEEEETKPIEAGHLNE